MRRISVFVAVAVALAIKDGIVYDAKQLLADVAAMVEKQKKERAGKTTTPARAGSLATADQLDTHARSTRDCWDRRGRSWRNRSASSMRRGRFAPGADSGSRTGAATRRGFWPWLLRLPRASEAAETRLAVTPDASGEQWRRTFDDRCLDTRQYRAGDGELAERFGVIEFRFRLEVSEGSLLYRQLEAAIALRTAAAAAAGRVGAAVDAREDPAGARSGIASTCASRSRRSDRC